MEAKELFTGIVEEIGKISSLDTKGHSGIVTIKANKVLEGTRVGDSIAVNGICLTVTKKGDGFFTADIMAETVRRSSLFRCVAGDPVNLERAMAADGRFGGHIVSGHIDGTGTIKELRREENAVWITVSADKGLLRYIIEKGSVAIDGVSLTVAYVDDVCFKVSVIPHTGEETILLSKRKGDPVNLETDIVGKYIEKLLFSKGEDKEADRQTGVTMEMLERYGF